MDEHRVEHPIALRLGQPRDLARHAERGEAVHAVGHEQIDDARQTLGINVAGCVKEWGRTEKTPENDIPCAYRVCQSPVASLR